MKIDLNVTGLAKVQDLLGRLSGPQAREAYAKGINDAAYLVRRNMQAQMRQAFDKPTPYILNSPWVSQATPDHLEAYVAPTYRRDSATTGGKIGVDPQRILAAQEAGGPRRDKRSEVLLRQMGILPAGFQTVVPAKPYPGSVDAYGNLRGPFMQQLLSYFQAFPELGFRANMTAKRKAQIHRGTAKVAGRRYFVSYGKARTQHHLRAGIWAAQGPGGVDVRPVLMFVRAGAYKPRISMTSLANDPALQDYLGRRLRYRIREAAGV